MKKLLKRFLSFFRRRPVVETPPPPEIPAGHFKIEYVEPHEAGPKTVQGQVAGQTILTVAVVKTPMGDFPLTHEDIAELKLMEEEDRMRGKGNFPTGKEKP